MKMRVIKRFFEEVYHVWATFLHITAMYCPYTPLKRVFYRARGTKIGRGVNVGMGVFMEEFYPGLIRIGDNVDIGPRVIILAHDSSKRRMDPSEGIETKMVVIENNVYIGAGSLILPGVRIREKAVVGAGSVVTNDVESNTIVAGVPARKIKRN